MERGCDDRDVVSTRINPIFNRGRILYLSHPANESERGEDRGHRRYPVHPCTLFPETGCVQEHDGRPPTYTMTRVYELNINYSTRESNYPGPSEYERGWYSCLRELWTVKEITQGLESLGWRSRRGTILSTYWPGDWVSSRRKGVGVSRPLIPEEGVVFPWFKVVLQRSQIHRCTDF